MKMYQRASVNMVAAIALAGLFYSELVKEHQLWVTGMLGGFVGAFLVLAFALFWLAVTVPVQLELVPYGT